ncbi:MAG TPA: sodium:solute symporter family protein [Clostridia bacterium]|nr:sodium:solute symporter family protein [Clostridia bacterium]
MPKLIPSFIVLAYLLLTLLIGFRFKKQASVSIDEFYLAGRSLSPLILFFTMMSTNFSAFTIFGLSGAGYRIGYAFYPVMGFGTGFMAISFFIIGLKILRLSKERGYITPSDFISDRYQSPLLRLVFSGVLVLFTLPYIAIQTIASGKTLHALIGLPYIAGAVLVTVFITLYVGLGGLRSIAWTDVIQGGMMIIFTLAAFVIIVEGAGGFASIHQALLQSNPEHFSRPGAGHAFPPGIWIGYFVLWFFADPMFPQLFQRFMAARDEKSLKWTATLYPLICTFLFFMTVSIGVIGKYVFPGLPLNQTDTVFPLLLNRYAGELIGALLLTGSIAALMSTLDSQLLTVSSIIIRDMPFRRLKTNSFRRLLIALIALSGLLIAVNPPDTILEFINKTSFNGLAVLAPTVIGGLYWRRGNRYGAFSSIATGELMVVLFYFDVLSTPRLLPVIPIMLASFTVYAAVSMLTRTVENINLVFPLQRSILAWTGIFGLFFLLGNDFWNWNRSPVLLLGLPGWIWYFILLGILLSGAFALFSFRKPHSSRLHFSSPDFRKKLFGKPRS